MVLSGSSTDPGEAVDDRVSRMSLGFESKVSGIQVFYCIIAFETAMRQQNFAKQN